MKEGDTSEGSDQIVFGNKYQYNATSAHIYK